MAAIIVVDLEDNASPGLDTINDTLIEVGQTSETVAAQTDQLTQAQQQQIILVQQLNESHLQQTEHLANIGRAVTGTGLAVAKFVFDIQKWNLAYRGLSETYKVGGNIISTALESQTAQWGFVRVASEKAGLSAIKAVTGLGPPILGATLALEGFRKVWSMTGKEVDEVTGEITTNLTRIDEASSRLGGKLAAPFVLMKDATVEWLTTPHPAFVAAWKQIDKDVTEGSVNMVNNLNAISDAFGGVTIEAEKSQKALEKQREKEAGGFAGIRDANAKLADAESSRQYAKRLAAMKTNLEFDNEERRVRELAAEAARAGEDRQQVEEKLFRDIEQIRTSRRSNEADELAESAKRHEEHTALMLRVYQGYQDARDKQIDDHNAKVDERLKEQQKATEAMLDAERDAVHEQQDEVMKNVINSLETQGDKRDEIHYAKLRQIDIETERAVAAAKTQEEAVIAASEGFRRRMREDGDFQRSELRRQSEERRKVEDEEKAARLAAVKQIEDAKGKSGMSAIEESKGRLNRGAVLKQIGRTRGERAAKAAREGGRSKAGIKAARDAAARSAGRDMRQGKLGGNEVSQAQSRVLEMNIQQANKTGEISNSTAKGMSEAVRNAQANLNALAQANEKIDRLTDTLSGITDATNGNSEQQRRNSPKGG